MRFRLRQLFVFTLVYALTLFFVISFTRNVGHPRFLGALNRMPSLQWEIRSYEMFNESPLSEDVINRWLSHSLTAADCQNSFVELMATRPPTFDVWGNPYRFVRREQNEDPDSEYGIYSVGIDGESGSNGNDPDDLNSWSLDASHYWQRYRNRRAKIALVVSLIGALVIYVVPLFLFWSSDASIRHMSQGRYYLEL